jgi:hypothetical protein
VIIYEGTMKATAAQGRQKNDYNKNTIQEHIGETSTHEFNHVNSRRNHRMGKRAARRLENRGKMTERYEKRPRKLGAIFIQQARKNRQASN